MSPTLLSTLALLFLSYTHNVNASWRMNGHNMISARVDPLVSPNAVASHVHNIVGGNNFAATYDYNTLRQSSCSTVEIQEDFSNYWAPALYYKHQDTGKFELVPCTGWAVYYLHRGEPNEHFVQFPAGFRMIAGSPNKRSKNSTDDDAFNYHCLGTDDPEALELPKKDCPDGVRIQVMFQSCWNGKDATSPNFKDHVSYPLGTHEGGKCPDTHPVRLMSVFLEQFADTTKFKYYPGAFVLSTGDNVGYSSHADFQNGWDASPNSVLEQAINTCTDAGADIRKCQILMDHQSDSFSACRLTTKLPVEDTGIYGGLDKIPGDNPIWGGDVPKVPTGVSNHPPWGSAFSTLPSGWVEFGCIDEGDSGANSLTGYKFVDDNMYPRLCVDQCNEKGFKLAGLEAEKECYCANELTNGGKMVLYHDQSACRAICPGNLYETCGGSRKINIYHKTDDSISSNVDPLYPPVGSRFTEVFTDNGTPMPIAAVVISNNTSSSAPQSSNPPSNSTPGSNGSMDPTSSAPSTPSTPSTPSAPSAPSAPSTPSTTATPATAATPTTEPVCHHGRLIKRRPSFRKREPVKSFHVPAKHRRMHH